MNQHNNDYKTEKWASILLTGLAFVFLYNSGVYMSGSRLVGFTFITLAVTCLWLGTKIMNSIPSEEKQ